MNESLSEWGRRWDAEGKYTRVEVPEVARRIEALVEMWRPPIPCEWFRPATDYGRLVGPRAGRLDTGSPHRGEHQLESELLDERRPAASVFGATLVDGRNAVALTQGKRTNAGHVETDLCLLVRGVDGQLGVVVGEVKVTAGSCWMAAVQNLKQLRLYGESAAAQGLLALRCPDLVGEDALPFSGAVIAPFDYYAHRGQKSAAVEPTRLLLERFRAEFGSRAAVKLGVWDADARTVVELR